MKQLLFIICTLLIIQSCSSTYYGYNKEDWNNLTYQERETIKDEYKSIIDSKQIQDHEDIIKERNQSIIDLAKEGLYHR